MFFKRKKLSETEFANKFAKALQEKIKGLLIISVNGLEVITKLQDSDEHRHFLHNAYIEYSHDIKELDRVLNKYLTAFCDSFTPKQPIALETILPVIKDKRFIQNLAEMNPEAAKQQVYEYYNSDLDIFYVVDTEHSLRYLTKKDTDELDLSIEALREVAINNLNRFDVRCHGEDGYYMLTAGGTYEASMILLDIWYKDNFDIDGNIIIAVPSRDVVLITGSRDSAIFTECTIR